MTSRIAARSYLRPWRRHRTTKSRRPQQAGRRGAVRWALACARARVCVRRRGSRGAHVMPSEATTGSRKTSCVTGQPRRRTNRQRRETLGRCKSVRRASELEPRGRTGADPLLDARRVVVIAVARRGGSPRDPPAEPAGELRQAAPALAALAVGDPRTAPRRVGGVSLPQPQRRLIEQALEVREVAQLRPRAARASVGGWGTLGRARACSARACKRGTGLARPARSNCPPAPGRGSYRLCCGRRARWLSSAGTRGAHRG